MVHEGAPWGRAFGKLRECMEGIRLGQLENGWLGLGTNPDEALRAISPPSIILSGSWTTRHASLFWFGCFLFLRGTGLGLSRGLVIKITRSSMGNTINFIKGRLLDQATIHVIRAARIETAAGIHLAAQGFFTW